jgi:phage shock protein PspC (stress-responsive transcriptional regulator)
MSEQEPNEEAAARAAEPEPEPEPEPASEPPEPPEPPAAEPVTEPLEVAVPGPRRLERSRDDRVIAGVCGGLGEYLGVDAVLIRIAALVLVFAGGAGVLLYAIGWIAMPEAPERGTPEAAKAASALPRERTGGAVALGLAFVVLGAFFLVDEIWSDFLAWKYIWPIALIAVGAVVLVRARR